MFSFLVGMLLSGMIVIAESPMDRLVRYVAEVRCDMVMHQMDEGRRLSCYMSHIEEITRRKARAYPLSFLNWEVLMACSINEAEREDINEAALEFARKRNIMPVDLVEGTPCLRFRAKTFDEGMGGK